jgi:hypothetical protein
MLHLASANFHNMKKLASQQIILGICFFVCLKAVEPHPLTTESLSKVVEVDAF